MYVGERAALASIPMVNARRGRLSDRWRSRCKKLGLRLRVFHPMYPAMHVFTELSLKRSTFERTNDFLKVQSLRFGFFSFQLPVELDQLKPVNLQCDISEMVFSEIFAGSGNLSKAAREVGYRIHPVDSTTKRQAGVAMHVLDLTKDSDAYVLLDLVCNANIASGHLAPPCGTASRSRERPLPAELGHIKSLPLRSDEHPLGLPGLQNLDAIRVLTSSRL